MPERHPHHRADRDRRLGQRVVERAAHRRRVVVSGSTRAITPMTLLGLTRREPVLLGDNLELMRAEPDEQRADGLPRPAVQHRAATRRGARWPPRRPRRAATGPASAGAATPPSCSSSPPTATPSTTTSASSSRGCARCAGPAPTGTLYFHIDWREAHYRQAAARRAVRPRVLPQRADLGLRLRRQAPLPLAAQARHDPRLRQAPARLLLRRRGGRPRALHGARARHAEKAARGKRPTDVMWHTIVSPTGREKTGYPTQKPEALRAPLRAGLESAR